MDASRRFGRGMAADTARKTELLEEALHPGEVLTLSGYTSEYVPSRYALDKTAGAPRPGPEM